MSAKANAGHGPPYQRTWVSALQCPLLTQSGHEARLFKRLS
jgi:hypothetical protein